MTATAAANVTQAQTSTSTLVVIPRPSPVLFVYRQLSTSRAATTHVAYSAIVMVLLEVAAVMLTYLGTNTNSSTLIIPLSMSTTLTTGLTRVLHAK